VITGHYRPDGTLRAVDVDYEQLDPATRLDICEWVKLHKLDPGLVPIRVEIGFDPATEEWVFPTYVPGDHGHGIKVDPTTRKPLLRRVRRRTVAWIPRANGQLLHAA